MSILFLSPLSIFRFYIRTAVRILPMSCIARSSSFCGCCSSIIFPSVAWIFFFFFCFMILILISFASPCTLFRHCRTKVHKRIKMSFYLSFMPNIKYSSLASREVFQICQSIKAFHLYDNAQSHDSIGTANSRWTCKGYMKNVHNGHTLVVCFAIQVTRDETPK